MRDSWDNMFEEVPASFEARMKETLSALEEKPKIRRFRFGTGALVAAALLVAVLGGTALATVQIFLEQVRFQRIQWIVL